MDNQPCCCEEDFHVGSKRGCLEVIEDLGAYYKEEREKKIKEKEKTLQEIQSGTCQQSTDKIVEDEYEIAHEIEKLKRIENDRYLLCKCKCGKKQIMSVEYFLSKKRHRYCDDYYSTGRSWDWWKKERDEGILAYGCGLRRTERESHLSKNQRKDSHYGEELPFQYHDTLEVIGFGEEKRTVRGSGRRNEFLWISKPYRCRCHLCGKEYEFDYEDFEIKNDGYGAKEGYSSKAQCDCHPTSSFQWRTIKLFRENNIQYMAEVSFPGLMGIGKKNLLRYDFAVIGNDGKKILVECQGEQHYKKTEMFGESFSSQQKNDEIKREYAAVNGLRLIEIPYTENTYKKEESFLRKSGLIK